MTSFGEFDLIRELLAPLSAPGSFGLTDDAAVLPKLRYGEAWTTTLDTVVEGVHFLPDSDPALLARKLLRVNLSDLASMGARPAAYFLSLSLNPKQDEAWLRGFCQGLAADQQEFGIVLYGGDTTSTLGPLTLSLTAMGAVTRGEELRRNGAKVDDQVCVSGPMGGAALGLKMLTGEIAGAGDADQVAITQYLLPRPKVALGQALVGRATACADISDGLAADVGHIARASGVGVEINCDAIPLIPALACRIADYPDLALTGGDDYELVFTLPPDTQPPEGSCVVGRVVEGDSVSVFRNGQPFELAQTGWRHF